MGVHHTDMDWGSDILPIVVFFLILVILMILWAYAIGAIKVRRKVMISKRRVGQILSKFFLFSVFVGAAMLGWYVAAILANGSITPLVLLSGGVLYLVGFAGAFFEGRGFS